jgi:carbonic anhydrase
MNSQTALQRLKTGIKQFQADVYPQEADVYQYAGASPQRPHTLVIACADSREHIEKITSSRVGDVFVRGISGT